MMMMVMMIMVMNYSVVSVDVDGISLYNSVFLGAPDLNIQLPTVGHFFVDVLRFLKLTMLSTEFIPSPCCKLSLFS